MKIIDLLNKIANGEEVPKKIIYKDKIYNFDCANGDYFNNENSEYLLADLFERCYTQDFINDKVEILEEEKEIPEEITMCTSGIMSFDAVENITTELKDKINSIIDYLKSKGDK